jgi:hypothetical protein
MNGHEKHERHEMGLLVRGLSEDLEIFVDGRVWHCENSGVLK